MNYGKAVKIVRAAQGLTQSELANRLSIGASHLSLIEVADAVGVSAGTLSRWEQGLCTPRRSHISRYAAVLDVIQRELA